MASTPATPSSDYTAMLPYWNMVETMLDGADAMRAALEAYLPKFPNETEADYTYRAANAKFTNIFADIVSNLASKPFAEKVQLEDGASERIKTLSEDIDGRGNNLHVFSSSTFFSGIAMAIDWILVDFTRAKPRLDGKPLSLAEEAQQGLRPYWVSIPAKSMIAVYSEAVRGKEEFVHARMVECIKRRSGFDEVVIERVRQFNREPILDDLGNVADYARATFTVWEKDAKSAAWKIVDAGPVTIGVIPIVPFITGRRKVGSWRFVPAMKDAADLQKEHYQQETALKSIKELTAFPMLAGNGVQPAMEGDKVVAVPVGPRTVLYAPPFGESGNHGEWAFIEPSAESLRFLSDDVKNTEQQLRELGRQPLTATQGITVVSAAYAGQKASSAVQAWAWQLKDALEQAYRLTGLWLRDTTPTVVKIFTDFALEIGDDKGPDALATMRSTGDLSQQTLWDEMKRRNVLSSDFDADAERLRLEEELPDPDSAADAEAALTPEKQAEQDALAA
jgi:hypothetical protein